MGKIPVGDIGWTPFLKETMRNHGPMAVFMLLVMSGAGTYLHFALSEQAKDRDFDREMRKEQQAQSTQLIDTLVLSIRTQTAAVEKLAEAGEVDRQFQDSVLDVHEQQLAIAVANRESLTTIRDHAADTNARMQAAELLMSEVPEDRKQMLASLKAIEEAIRARDGT